MVNQAEAIFQKSLGEIKRYNIWPQKVFKLWSPFKNYSVDENNSIEFEGLSSGLLRT